MRLPSSVATGLRAARANLVPGLFLWALAAGTLAAYWWHEPTRRALAGLAEVRRGLGLLFSMPSTALAAALLPYVVARLFFGERAALRGRDVGYLTLFWGCKGAEVDLLYRAEARLFGDSSQLSSVLPKVLFDQLVYCPLWAIPVTAVGYEWILRRSLRAALARIRRGGYRDCVVPILVSNWLVWTPAVAAIYCLEQPLQLPMQNLVLCFWALLMGFLAPPGAAADGLRAPLGSDCAGSQERAVPDPPKEPHWDRFFRRAEARAKELGISLNESVELEWSGTRDWLEKHLRPHLRSERPAICEIGPGTGRFTRHLIESAQAYYMVDYSPHVCDVLRRDFGHHPAARVVLVRGCDMAQVPTESCDFAFSIGTFVHLYLEQIDRYLRELARVLKPGGRVVLHFANFMSEGGYGFFDQLVRDSGNPDLRIAFRFYHPDMIARIARKVALKEVALTTFEDARHAFWAFEK